MLVMIVMAMLIIVRMYQQECHMDWISDGGYDDRAGSDYSDPLCNGAPRLSVI